LHSRVYINATSTPRQKNRTSMHKQAIASYSVQKVQCRHKSLAHLAQFHRQGLSTVLLAKLLLWHHQVAIRGTSSRPA